MCDTVIPGPVETQLKAILRQEPGADCIALVWPEPLPEGEIEREIDGIPLRLVHCPSQLAMREQLVDHHPGGSRLVLLSRFDESTLARDVLARLWKYEPRRISPWRTLQQLLGVSSLDPRISGKEYRWLAEVLVSHLNRFDGRITFGAVLDLPTAWRALALGLMNFEAEEPDLQSLLAWSLQPDVKASVNALPVPVMEHLGDWLSPRLGDLAPLVKALWESDHAADMAAVGLVCDLLYSPNREASEDTYQARGRLIERFLGGQRFGDNVLRRFGNESSEFIARQQTTATPSGVARIATRAEHMLSSLGLAAIAIESDLLPAAYGQRLDAFATTLNEAVRGGGLSPACDALAALRRHKLAQARDDQVQRATLALRTCSWLAHSKAKAVPPNGVGLVRRYVEDGGHLDWARSRIWSGDEHERLSDVYAELSKHIGQEREAMNKSFADHLPVVARGDLFDSGITYVENCLERLILPLAKESPLLLLVVDGMSQAVFRELSDDLLVHQWVELRREEFDGPECLLATIPSITRLSRYSLLAGKLGEGGSAEEKKAFEGHSGLKSARTQPVLFHKADLQVPGSGGLSPAVRAAIADDSRKVVAAVINAVDDQLSSNAQVAVRWTLDQVALLPQILAAAREAGRLVVMTSDHGHVLDHAMTYRPSSGENERFRPGSEEVAEGELRLSGSRVLTGETVVPWSENIRYAREKMGYHGGASLQEIIIPIGIFRSAGENDEIAGWREVPRQSPDWWAVDGEATSVESSTQAYITTTPTPSKNRRPADELTQDMFDKEVAQATASTDWIDALLNSDLYKSNKSRAGRATIGDKQLRQLLQYLVERGGQAMLPAIGQALSIPSIRQKGFIAGARRLLNIDGYDILALDHGTGTVKLNVEVLKAQFEL